MDDKSLNECFKELTHLNLIDIEKFEKTPENFNKILWMLPGGNLYRNGIYSELMKTTIKKLVDHFGYSYEDVEKMFTENDNKISPREQFVLNILKNDE